LSICSYNWTCFHSTKLLTWNP